MSKPTSNRPRLYTTLLSDSIQGITEQVSVYSMIILDEITLRTPDALMSGATCEQIIQNCCPDIKLDNLLLCDVQHLLANIKVASSGMNIDMYINCPKCNTSDPYEFDLSKTINLLSSSKWNTPLPITFDNNLILIYFKCPLYKDWNKYAIADFKLRKQIYTISKLESQEGYEELLLSLIEKQRNLLNSFNSQSIIKVIVSNNCEVNEPKFIKEWYNQIDVSLQNKINDYIASANKQCSLPDMNIICSSCNHNFVVPIDLDFCSQFRNKIIPLNENEIIDMISKMDKECKSITSELLKLVWYMRGSISYSDSYYLTVHERETIVKIIQENIETSKKVGYPII